MLTSRINVPEALRRMEVCLTGHNGYIGRHMVQALVGNGICPHLIGRPGGGGETMPGAQSLATWETPEDLARQLSRLANPVILNVAGHFVSRHEAHDIPDLVSGNLEYPVTIFEALRISGHARIVNIGTSWEYSDTGKFGPVNLYAHLKASNAGILDWYAKEYSLNAINLKLNDTYGGVDGRAKLMPLLKKHWLSGETMHLRARSQMLNLLHITDVLEGLLEAAAMTENAGSLTGVAHFLLARETVSLEELIALINENASSEIKVTYHDMSDNNPGLRTIWEAAPALPNWSPRVALAEGIRSYFV